MGASGEIQPANGISGGNGGETSGTISVNPGEQLTVYVGCQGHGVGGPSGYAAGGDGGTNGNPDAGNGGGGGGASAVLDAQTPLVVAGGGGGGGGNDLNGDSAGAGGSGGSPPGPGQDGQGSGEPSNPLTPGCGGCSGGQTGTNAGHAATLTKYSACMRSHGVSNFPDPSTSQSGGNSFGVDGYNFNLPATLNMQSPAYQTADKACQSLIGLGETGPARNPAFVAKAKQAALARAQCMRAHGVTNFPDPTFTSTGGGIAVSSGGMGINPRSPAF